jgi:hypothetical protein
MAKSIDQQIKDAMATKVVGRTTDIYKAVVLELYKRITANSLQVGIAYGSPGLTGRYYASHAIAGGGAIGLCVSRTRKAKRLLIPVCPSILVKVSVTCMAGSADRIQKRSPRGRAYNIMRPGRASWSASKVA